MEKRGLGLCALDLHPALSERGTWLPTSRLSRRSNFLHHLINLLEGKTLCLPYEEISVEETDGAQSSPDEEDLGTEVSLVFSDHVGRDDCNDAVPEPVGGGGHGDAAGPNGDRVDLADEDPRTGTPGGREEENVDADKGDLDLGDGRVIGFGSSLLLVETDT